MPNSPNASDLGHHVNTFTARAALLCAACIVVVLAVSSLVLHDIAPLASVEILPSGATIEQNEKFLRSINPKDRSNFENQLRSEIQRRPLQVDPIKKLAALAQTGPQPADGNALVMLVADRIWRDLALQSSALQLEVEQKNYSAVINRLNIILMTQPDKKPEVMKLLAKLTAQPSLMILVEALATRPALRRSFLPEVTANAEIDPDIIYSLFLALRKAGAPANNEEMRGFLKRLLSIGADDKAYFIWLDSLEEDSLKRAGLLFDGGFDLPLGNQFFSWTVDKLTTVDVRTAPRGPGSVDKVLRIEFSPRRTPYKHFGQFMKLAPGAYVLSGEAKSENLVTPVGLVWQITCTSKSQQVLAQTTAISGNTSWTAFETSFEVPQDNCPTQSLRLKVNARVALDTQISGHAQFDNLVVSPKKQ